MAKGVGITSTRLGTFFVAIVISLGGLFLVVAHETARVIVIVVVATAAAVVVVVLALTHKLFYVQHRFERTVHHWRS